jgi:hypothetical protein
MEYRTDNPQQLNASGISSHYSLLTEFFNGFTSPVLNNEDWN